jgi:hypothetical protein
MPRPTVTVKVEKLTRDDFLRYLHNRAILDAVEDPSPATVQPCTCRDINCRGWKLVTRES